MDKNWKLAAFALLIVMGVVLWWAKVMMSSSDDRPTVPFENRNGKTVVQTPTGGGAAANSNSGSMANNTRPGPGAKPPVTPPVGPSTPAAAPPTQPTFGARAPDSLPRVATPNPGLATPPAPTSDAVQPRVAQPGGVAAPATTPAERPLTVDPTAPPRATPPAVADAGAPTGAVPPSLRPQPAPIGTPSTRTAPPTQRSAMSGLVNSGSAGASTSYTIQEGDTLAEISEQFYGEERYWKQILNANPGLDPGRLFVGKKIVMPAREAVVASRGAGSAPATSELPRTAPPTSRVASSNGSSKPSVGAGRTTYKVGKSDTLISIAREVLGNGSRWKEIYELNKSKLKSPDVLPVGIELVLPEGVGSRPTSRGAARGSG